MTVQLLKLLFWYLEWWDCGLWDWEDETGVCVTGPLRYCFDTWTDETRVDETGDDETRVYETVDYETWVWETGKMSVLAGAHETNLDELKTIITLVLTFNI